MGVERVIGHKEWAGAAQGKWDPGAIDMNIFRGDIAARLRNSSGEVEDMAAVPQQEWNEVREWIRRCALELTQPHPSRSPLRKPNDPYRDTMAGYILNGDGHGHLNRVKILASLGHPDSIQLLRDVAALRGNPDFPDRQDDAQVAQQILHEIFEGPNANLIQNAVKSAVLEAMSGTEIKSVSVTNAPISADDLATTVSNAAAAAAASAVARAFEGLTPFQGIPPIDTTKLVEQIGAGLMAKSDIPPADELTAGQRFGRAYDALADLGISNELSPEERATLGAMLGVLQTKIGDQPS